jgi:hypothetical protein
MDIHTRDVTRDVYVSQAFMRRSNSQRVARLLHEMHCVLHVDRRLQDIKTSINRRADSTLSSPSAGKRP